MDAYNCERNWAKRVPTGLPGNLCFGLERSQYVPFWCAVAALVYAYYLFTKATEPKDGKAGVPRRLLPRMRALLQRLVGKKPEGTSELEKGLLNGAAAINGNGKHHPTSVACEEMARVCAAEGSKGGLKAASLAAFLALHHRRRYGTLTAGVIVAGRPQVLDVDLEAKETSFVELLQAVDKALAMLAEASLGAASNGEVPELILVWGEEQTPSLPGSWIVKQVSPRHLEVVGASLEEELSFQRLFEAAAATPNADVWHLPLVPQASLDLVKSWGSPAKDFAPYRDASTKRLRPVTQVLADRRGAPSAAAVQGDGFKITYEELWRRSAAIASAVQQQAMKDKQKAAVVFMGRGETIGPTIIGILQAGYTVIPVDVHWPAERARLVAEDAEVGLVLTEPAHAAAWSEIGVPGVPVLLVEDAFFQAKNGASPTPQVLDQDDPAIVLFTSGSTGKPKGIVLSHGYLTSLVVGVAESKRMTERTKTLCYHSPTWMPFLDYLFAPLIVGGTCLYFPEKSTHVVKPTELKDFAVRHAATSAGFVPAVLDILLEEGLPKSLSDIGVGGAAVPAELCHRALAVMPPASDGSSGILYTGYSGTEQGDVTQIKMRTPEDVEHGTADKGYMGAGRPHAGQRCAVLDQCFNVVGPDGIGEISVAGPGLASGYLKLPDKTAETFMPSLKALDGVRAARTGDLGKWTVSGNIKVVGRRDSMVKVRGARVELGEVETAVLSHVGVKAAVVTVFEDQLVAYVTPAVPGDLRDYCKARLVAYMVPHIFHGLEELPRLPNGKVNKKALPKPEQRADGAETVMELDSLGQMRKFTRRAASEDRILDNVRAILIGVVIQSHAIPTMVNSGAMFDVASRPLEGSWGPVQLFLLNITRGGGWSSLAFLNGFDDTRGMKPYGFTYREPFFLTMWFLLRFNWTMWYLPVFVMMKAVFNAAHWVGLERTHMLLAAQIWIFLPAFVDLYIGWMPQSPEIPAECPENCFCPWQEWPWAQSFAYYTSGWWVAPGNPVAASMLGHALIFIPCYWIGFYLGAPTFAFLTKVADEASLLKRLLWAGFVLGIYCLMYLAGQPLLEGYDDRCSAYWAADGRFVWWQVLKNATYFAMNLAMSLTYVVFIAAAVPVHLKYLAKICFFSLIMSAETPCLLDFPSMALEIRKVASPVISPLLETLWVFTVPFLYELVVGALAVAAVTFVAKGMIKLASRAYTAVFPDK